MLAAQTGKITGVMLIGFNQHGGFGEAIAGKVPFQAGLAAIEKIKFGILARDYFATMQQK